MTENKMIGVPEYAKIHGFAYETVRKWCRNHKLADVEQDGKGRPWRIPIDAAPPGRKRKSKG